MNVQGSSCATAKAVANARLRRVRYSYPWVVGFRRELQQLTELQEGR